MLHQATPARLLSRASRHVEGTEILVFYPEDGVSAMQKKQMTTQEGGNVGVCAIKGNFDDSSDRC